MTDQYLHVPLAEITASLTNPRTSFEPAKLAELAEDIKRRGVDSPILLRPLPGMRVADTDRKVKYEIVFGERRYRASQQAGVQTIPARVREMTDEQALEAQLVENLHRTDLTALEEAEGYQRLMEHGNLTADQVGEKIGKSRTYIYNRLKLLDLGTEGREALRKGKLDYSVAMLIARIPDGKLQAKALKDVSHSTHGEPMSYRRAQELMQSSYMLKLTDARFKIADATLVPAAGSCKECPKRTGANPDLFADVKSADVCTDPPCFHKKEEAAAALLVKEAKARGQTVIAGKEAQELATGYYGNVKYKGYKRLDDKEDSPTDEPLRKLIGPLMDERAILPTMLEHPSKKGQLVACLPNDVANTLLKEVQARAKAEGKTAPPAIKSLLQEKASQEKAKLDAKFQREVHAQLIAETWAVIEKAYTGKAAADSGSYFTMAVHRHLAAHTAWSLDTDAAEAVCKLLDLGKVGARHGLAEEIKKDPQPDLLHLLLLMHSRSGEGFDLVTEAVHGDNLKAVTNRIQAEVKDRVYPKPAPKPAAKTAKKPAPANDPAARRTEGAGGKASKPTARAAKLSPEEAKRGIAAAMQGVEGSASAPKGAVAPPAAPDAAKGLVAWPFPKTADEKASERIAAAKKAPAKAAPDTPPDPLLAKAIKVITEAQAASVRLLKEKLGIGTTKAMELMASLEAAGKVSEATERGARKVLVAA